MPTKMSNLVNHAWRELQLIGEDEETIKGYLGVIRAFARMEHSGASAAIAIPVINELLLYHNLSPITDDPEEWIEHVPEMWDGKSGVWQNKRRGEAFSNDGGKTYYLLDEVKKGWWPFGKSKKVIHTSEKKGYHVA